MGWEGGGKWEGFFACSRTWSRHLRQKVWWHCGAVMGRKNTLKQTEHVKSPTVSITDFLILKGKEGGKGGKRMTRRKEMEEEKEDWLL